MKLKELRKTRNLTQTEVAKYLNIATNTYCWYELKRIEPPIEALIKLADYYNVSLDYLCEHETEHLIDTSNWSETKKGVVFILNQLNEQNALILLGYITHVLEKQNR